MDSERPRTALEAVTRRRLLLSGWPWRSAWYLLTTLPPAALAFGVLAVPWLVLTVRLTSGDFRLGPIVMLVLLGTGLVAALGPLVSVPLAGIERRRLRIVDTRPVEALGRTAAAGPGAWLRSRYTDPAAWRETGYVFVLGTAAPVLAIAVLLTGPLLLTFIVSPFVLRAQRPGDGPVALAVGQVTAVEQTVPYVIAGVVLLPFAPYAVTLLAGVQAALARFLLLGGPGERLRAELVEVSRSRTRLVDAFEAERHRIERDLHDGAQQRLVGLTLKLGLARLDLPPDSRAAETVTEAHEQAKQLMAELRELIHGIRPQILTDLGLPAAIGELADRSAIPVAVDARLPKRLPREAESTAYFVVAEALANVARHSGATSASVNARRHGDLLAVEVVDDGRGGADPDRGTGLTGLADRVAVAGGRMLLSSPPGGPTLLRVEVPCDQSRPSE